MNSAEMLGCRKRVGQAHAHYSTAGSLSVQAVVSEARLAIVPNSS